MLHSVIQVKPTLNFEVYVYFDDGTIKLFNMNPLLGVGVFQQIADVYVFMDKCTVINHTLAWDMGGNLDPYKCIDIDPETIYNSGVDVEDPLAAEKA